MPRVYAVTHVPPEVSAYGMAKYSRSRASLQDSLLELSQQQAEQFLNTFYFAYGHASIADLAHVALAIEDISMLAAMDIVDEPLWDGQERSTRYQDFRQAPYWQPDDAPAPYREMAETLFSAYQSLFQEALEAYQARYQKPAAMTPGAYQRALKARAFDVARYLLPLATLTSLGQVTNARVLEGQIARLMASPVPEIAAVARAMKTAVTKAPPYNLIAARLSQKGVSVPEPIRAEIETGPVVPTLVKYTEASAYPGALSRVLAPVAADLFAGLKPDPGPEVALYLGDGSPEIMLATLLYGQTHLSFGQILSVVKDLSARDRDDIFASVLDARGDHDPWPPAFRQAPLIFDLVIDVGAFRDFNRHRRLQKTVQSLHPGMGYAVPAPLTELSFGKDYRPLLDRHYRALDALEPLHQRYLLPLAHRRRALFAMDWAEAAYLIELRSRSQGHFSYRAMAVAMHRELARHDPALARHIRVTPLEAFDPLER